MSRRRIHSRLAAAQAHRMRTAIPGEARVPLQCDGCTDAYQVPEWVGLAAGGWCLVSYHSDTCPIVQRVTGGQAA
jgi:hypothetical protein